MPDSVKLALGALALVSTMLLLSTLVSRRQLGRALRRAHHDAVTGLPNRAAMDEALDRMVAQARRRGTPLAVVMVDLDHFKSINDVYGHAMGDEVLALVGGVARSAVRTGDFVGRYGGEEFLLLAPDTDEPGARAVAQKLQHAFRGVAAPELERQVTASFGVAAATGSPAALRGPAQGGGRRALPRKAERARPDRAGQRERRASGPRTRLSTAVGSGGAPGNAPAWTST